MPDQTDDDAPGPATWDEVAAIVRARYPLIPEDAIQRWVEIYRSTPQMRDEPEVWQLAHAAYGWARRDPSWRIRIAVLERERQEAEARFESLLAAARQDKREQRQEEELDDVERLRRDALDLLEGIVLAVSVNKPRRDMERLIQEAITILREWR
jgi:hypothetical protein